MTSSRQISQQKKRMREMEKMLERNISLNWNDLKASLQPSAVAKETVQGIVQAKTTKMQNEQGIFKSVLAYGLNLLANKFSEKAEEKMKKFWRKKGK